MNVTDDIAEFKAFLTSANASLTYAQIYRVRSRIHWSAGQDHDAIEDIITTMTHYENITGMLIGRYAPFYPEYALTHIFDHLGVGGGGTMDDILSEMMSASFEQLTKFMGITQAYKVAVWDAPFNEEFYAALARGFKTWGA